MKGCSTANKIERWWRDLHEQLEKHFKLQRTSLWTLYVNDQHNLDYYVHMYIYTCIKLYNENAISSICNGMCIEFGLYT